VSLQARRLFEKRPHTRIQDSITISSVISSRTGCRVPFQSYSVVLSRIPRRTLNFVLRSILSVMSSRTGCPQYSLYSWLQDSVVYPIRHSAWIRDYKIHSIFYARIILRECGIVRSAQHSTRSYEILRTAEYSTRDCVYFYPIRQCCVNRRL